MPPTVTKQTATAPVKKQGAISRIAPISFGQKKDSFCIYGYSGTGKTTLAATYPKPLLLIGAEDGTRSIHNVKGVEFIRLKSTLELTDIINHVKQSRKYETVVLDTATSLQAMVIAEIKGMDELPTQLSWGFATREEWGQCALQTKEWLNHLLKLAENNICHTLILAQERGFNKKNDNEQGADSDVFAPKVMASVSESTVGWLNPACDYVVQTYITTKMIRKELPSMKGVKQFKMVPSDEVEYRLRTRAHEFYLIKFRVPKGHKAPPYIADPDYDKIQAVIRGIPAEAPKK